MTAFVKNCPPKDAAERKAVEPVTVYPNTSLPALDARFYENVRTGMEKIGEVVVPPRDARTFEVPAGHIFRIVSVEGPQVGDLNLWNLNDTSERFFSGKTRAIHATHVNSGNYIKYYACF